MLLRDHGYLNFSHEKVARLLGNDKPQKWGTGYRSPHPSYRREVFLKNNRIYKLWAKDYLWADLILEGIRSEFYDDCLTSALVGVILDSDGDVRGYVMEKCSNITHPKQWGEMMEKLYTQTKKTLFCFPDCIQSNVGVFRGKLTLFDLEHVVPVKKGLQTKFSVYNHIVEKLCCSDES